MTASIQASMPGVTPDFGSLVGWTVWGSEYSVVVVGNTRVVVRTSRGDYNRLMIDLIGSNRSACHELLMAVHNLSRPSSTDRSIHPSLREL